MIRRAILAIVILAAAMPAVAQTTAIDIGSAKQLFVDDLVIERMQGVQVNMHQPVKDPAPVLSDTAALYWPLFNCVLQDGEKIRMYYTPRYGNRLRVAYAESTDGVNWTLPKLGLVELDGSKENNLIWPLTDPPVVTKMQLEGGNVFIDENPACPADEKYKMCISWKGPNNDQHGVWVLVSGDGIHFRALSDKPSFRPSDTGNTLLWDSRIGRYVAYVRLWRQPPSRRVVARCEFDDPRDFGEEQIVMAADEKDDHELMDIYTNAVHKYEGIYFSFPSIHAHHRTWLLSKQEQAARGDGKKPFGGWDVQLAVSRDGINWQRPIRHPFVPAGEYEDWDSGMVSMFTGMVVTRSEIFMYYWGRNYPHMIYGPLSSRRVQNGMGRLRLRLDGFYSADAGYTEAGELLTKPVVFSGKNLVLNFQTGVSGSIKVELLDEQDKPIPGFSLEEMDEVYGNFVRRTVSWAGKEDVGSLAGKNVRVRFVMRDAKLYSFQFAK